MSEGQIRYINNGIVIDHLPVGRKLPEIIKILGLAELVERDTKVRYSTGNGFESKRASLGRKSFLKVQGRMLDEYELNLVALIAPDATVNFIKDGKVVEKKKVFIPNQLDDIVCCVNPGCITNHANEKVRYNIAYDAGSGIFTCHYCDTSFGLKDVKLNLKG